MTFCPWQPYFSRATIHSCVLGWVPVPKAISGAAMRYAFFAFSGWEGATYVAEEVRDPEKNLPRSILWGIGVVLGIYLLVNLAYLKQLGPAEPPIVFSTRRYSSGIDLRFVCAGPASEPPSARIVCSSW